MKERVLAATKCLIVLFACAFLHWTPAVLSEEAAPSNLFDDSASPSGVIGSSAPLLKEQDSFFEEPSFESDTDVKNIFDRIEAAVGKSAVVPEDDIVGDTLPENARQFTAPVTIGGKPVEEAVTPLHVAGLVAYGFGVTDFRVVKRFAEKVLSEKSGGSFRSGAYNIKGDERRAIIKHLRFQEGIPFPSEEELRPEPIDQEVLARFLRERFGGITQEQKQQARELFRAQQRAFLTPPQLPACIDSKTVKVRNAAKERNYYGAIAKEGVLFDALFVKASAPDFRNTMTGPDELFGERTRLHYYEPHVRDRIAHIAAEKGVECLPFRIRVTEDFIFKDYGENALRNYDKQIAGRAGYNGKGKLHPAVQDQLSEFF